MIDDQKQQRQQLMIQIQAGDQDAYQKLFDQIGGKIMSVIRGRIRDIHIQEELYQTVLLTLHRARHTYDPIRPFDPWLYSITRNTVFDYLRKNRKKIELETLVGEHFSATAPVDTNPSEQALLAKALDTLPEKQKQAVILLKIDGLTLEEAAAKCDVTVAAMKVRAHRGYANLKSYLTKEIKEAS